MGITNNSHTHALAPVTLPKGSSSFLFQYNLFASVSMSQCRICVCARTYLLITMEYLCAMVRCASHMCLVFMCDARNIYEKFARTPDINWWSVSTWTWFMCGWMKVHCRRHCDRRHCHSLQCPVFNKESIGEVAGMLTATVFQCLTFN